MGKVWEREREREGNSVLLAQFDDDDDDDNDDDCSCTMMALALNNPRRMECHLKREDKLHQYNCSKSIVIKTWYLVFDSLKWLWTLLYTCSWFFCRYNH